MRLAAASAASQDVALQALDSHRSLARRSSRARVQSLVFAWDAEQTLMRRGWCGVGSQK